MARKLYTVYLSFPETPTGVYDEEVDVLAQTEAEARRKAILVSRTIHKQLRVRRVELYEPRATWS